MMQLFFKKLKLEEPFELSVFIIFKLELSLKGLIGEYFIFLFKFNVPNVALLLEIFILYEKLLFTLLLSLLLKNKNKFNKILIIKILIIKQLI